MSPTPEPIVTINSAFATLTGYTREEAVGKTTRLLKSGRHDHGFYADMWQESLTRGKWEGEIGNRRKNGELSSNGCRSMPSRMPTTKLSIMSGSSATLPWSRARRSAWSFWRPTMK